ncbi:acylphosphatase [Oceanobacillus caeni]
MEKNYEWLPHLQNSIPVEAYGYRLSMYSIALEGWRRGLTLKFSKSPNRYSLSFEDREHHFSSSRGDMVTQKAIRICVNKDLTKEYLAKANIPIPEGKIFSAEETTEEIVDYANVIGYPLVIKPTNSSGGNGVISNITNDEELKQALVYVRSELLFSSIIVEQFSVGEDYRIYVLGDSIIGAVSRKPANVVGTGIDTIRQLIKAKDKERDKNPALYNQPIKIDEDMENMLRLKNYTLDSIPKQSEKVFLKSINNVSVGGDPIDVTDDLPNEIKNVAIDAVKSIPGLAQAGVDIIFNKEKNKYVVLEVNSKPSIRTHLFPMQGKARDIPKAIIDYYFPETIHHNHEGIRYYFDFLSLDNLFQSGFAKEFTIPNVPQGDLVALEMLVSGIKRSQKWIRKKARSLDLNGFVKPVKNGNISIVVSGSKEAIHNFKDILKDESEKVLEGNYEQPIKIGFEIIDNKQAEYEILKNERNFYKKKYQAIKDSKAWRATRPIRTIGSFTKNKMKK